MGPYVVYEWGCVTRMNLPTLMGRGKAQMWQVGLWGCLFATLLATKTAAARNEIMLKSRRFVPVAGVAETPKSLDGGRIHVLLQLETIPTDDQRITLAQAGVNLLSYIPNRAWLASVPLGQVEAVVALPSVRAMAKILPEDKIDPALREEGVNAYSTTDDGQVKLVALFFEDVALDVGLGIVATCGGRVIKCSEADNSAAFHLPLAALYDLASCDAVKWIDQHYESIDLNDGARAALNVDAVQLAPYHLTGHGVVVGQWESKHPDANHMDLVGRVTNIEDGWGTGDHATQVAGTILGDGSLLNSRRYRGMAPAATLVSYHSWENTADLRSQYDTALNVYNIDISNNSWGKVEWHQYKDYTAALDDLVHGASSKPISIVCAAGNEGDWGTIMSTAVGKNVVTVGATNSDDGSLWTWSNKGPTGDGRIKPDVVSPGCETRLGGAIWSTLPGNLYGGACGTSLAAPSVSGVMALMLEDWRAIYETDPFPSTLKGLLIHTATDWGLAGPDYACGYGLVNAQKAIDLIRADTLDDVIVEDHIERNGQRDVYAIEVGADRKELKVTLVWDDFPGDPLAAQALVNDLDLVVIGPAGARHYPWTLDPDEPEGAAERLNADHTNNVEQVYVENPRAGTWLITVWGASVPQAQQKYSLLSEWDALYRVRPGTPVFSVSDRFGEIAAEFDDAGNLVLQGAAFLQAQCVPPAGALTVGGPAGEVVGYIDLDGNLCLAGEVNELSNCDLTRGGLVVRNSFGETVAHIDTAGNLCLAGRLYQNPQE